MPRKTKNALEKYFYALKNLNNALKKCRLIIFIYKSKSVEFK